MKFKDPNTGAELEVPYTPELSAALAEARPPDCSHSETEIRARVVQGGGVQVKAQCLTCGAPIGSPLRKVDHPNASPFNETLLAASEKNRELARWNAAKDYLIRRDQGSLKHQRDYNDYISSPDWRRKRDLVLQRARGICEGCMEKNAQEVHHLTYRNFRAEFLFELVALCRECHLRIHDRTQRPDTDSLPCRGCRFQGGEGANCLIFDVPEATAISEARYCGPALRGFEALK